MNFKANPCTTNPSVPLCLCDSVLKRNDDKGVGIFNTEARSHRGTENDGIRA